MVEEGLLLVLRKGEIWEGHHLFGQVGPQVVINTGVDREAGLGAFANLGRAGPVAPNIVRLLVDNHTVGCAV